MVVAPDGSFCIARSAFVVTRAGGGGQAQVIACNDPSVSRKGGWHQIADDRSAFGQYCRNAGANKGGSAAYLELPIQSVNGGTVSVIYARGPRGGNADAGNGSESRRIEFFRPPVNPSKPDQSGRNDLTFGFSETFPVPPGGGRLRIDVRNDHPDPQRDMGYIEGFVFTESAAQAGQARHRETGASSSGTLPPGGSVTVSYTPPAGSIMLTAIADAIETHDLALVLRNPMGVVVPSVDDTLTPDIAQAFAILPGAYSVTITNRGVTAAPYSLFMIPTVDLTLIPRALSGGWSMRPLMIDDK
jgi:hypothetical protein